MNYKQLAIVFWIVIVIILLITAAYNMPAQDLTQPVASVIYDAGYGFGTSRKQRNEEDADIMTFLMETFTAKPQVEE